MKLTIGIYKIENLVNGKVYIGQSVDIEKRWGVHLSTIKNNKHKNIYLQNSWNKYGEGSFLFSIIEKCSAELLDDKEIHWIKAHNSSNVNNGYNLTQGGNSLRGELNPFYGKKHTQETIEILRAHSTGKHQTKESLQKQNESKKGKYHGENSSSNILTEDQVIKIITMLQDCIPMVDVSNSLGISYDIVKSIKQKRNWKYLTKDIEFPNVKKSRHGKNNSMYGKKHTSETRLKISLAHVKKVS